MTELGISTVRELEDLVIEGISAGVVQGKLDQKCSHFEVDYVIGRDIRLVVQIQKIFEWTQMLISGSQTLGQ